MKHAQSFGILYEKEHEGKFKSVQLFQSHISDLLIITTTIF